MLYLASNSPQRSEILRSLSVGFSLLNSDFDEKPLHFLNIAPMALSKKIALAKLDYALDKFRDTLTGDDSVFAADTMIFLDRKTMYGKPESKEKAEAMLRSYSGRAHYAVTSIAGCNVAKGKKLVTTQCSKVWFSKLSDAEIIKLLECNEWQDAAGAYRIQGKASFYIKKIAGSYTGVLGFPVHEFYELTKKLKVWLS